MDYEKKYKEALETARKINSGEGVAAPPDWTVYEVIFPELRESEDERIRKTIIRFFKDQYSNETEMYDGSVTVGKAIAWLEKQGEKSTFNKERLMEVAKPETFEEQIEHWQRMRGIAEEMVKELPEKQDKKPSVLSNSLNIGKDLQVDGFDAELNALLKKYEYLPYDEMVECLKWYTAELINNK